MHTVLYLVCTSRVLLYVCVLHVERVHLLCQCIMCDYTYRTLQTRNLHFTHYVFLTFLQSDTACIHYCTTVHEDNTCVQI